jgi:hypothetical protein
MAILLPVNNGHTCIIRNQVAAPLGNFADTRITLNPSDPEMGIVDLRASVPFSAARLGGGVVNILTAYGLNPIDTLEVVGSAIFESPVSAGPGDWTKIFEGLDATGPALPDGDTPYLSFVNAKYAGGLIGAAFEGGLLSLLEWTITPPVYTGNLLTTPGTASAVVLDTLAAASPDKPGAIWQELGGSIYFGGVKSGKLFVWDGGNVTLDGTPGAGADVLGEQSGDLIIAGTNYIKRRTGAGAYTDIMPTGTLTPPALTVIQGLAYHLSATAGEFGGVDTANEVFTPACAVKLGDDLYIAGSIYVTADSATRWSIVFKVSALACIVVALRGGSETIAPPVGGQFGLARMMPYGYGVLGMGVATYPFDDASLDAPVSSVISGTSPTVLSGGIFGVGTFFLSELQVGDLLDLSGTPGNPRVVVRIDDDTHCAVSAPIGNGPTQTITRIRSQPVSAAGDKLFFLDISSGSGHLGMFDPTTGRWYWNRMVALWSFGPAANRAWSLNDWPVGGLYNYAGDLVYTMKAKDPTGFQYYLLNRISMQKHLPVDTLTTGFQRDYIFAPEGDLPPLYNGGYYQFWTPWSGVSLTSFCAPAVGGWDRFQYFAANFGRVIIELNDDGTVA